MTQPPTQPRGSSADIAWLDSRIKELEDENEALRVKYEGLCDAIYNLSLVDLLEVKGE